MVTLSQQLSISLQFFSRVKCLPQETEPNHILDPLKVWSENLFPLPVYWQ